MHLTIATSPPNSSRIRFALSSRQHRLTKKRRERLSNSKLYCYHSHKKKHLTSLSLSLFSNSGCWNMQLSDFLDVNLSFHPKPIKNSTAYCASLIICGAGLLVFISLICRTRINIPMNAFTDEWMWEREKTHYNKVQARSTQYKQPKLAYSIKTLPNNSIQQVTHSRPCRRGAQAGFDVYCNMSHTWG